MYFVFVFSDYILFGRNIFESNRTELSNLTYIPSEYDELFFEYLQTCDYDINFAKSKINSILSFGKGCSCLL